MSRGNDNSLHRQGTIMPFRQSLVDKILGAPAARVKRKPRIFNGTHPVREWTRPKHTDAVMLEVRRLKEQQHMMPRAIVSHLLDMDVHVTREDVIRICSYATRGHLVPDEGAAPYLTKAKS